MDKDLKEMIEAVYRDRLDPGFTWQDIYQTLYAEDEAGLGGDVELLDESTQMGLFKKLESSRKDPGEGGYQRGYYFFTKPTFSGESRYRVVLRTVDQRTAIRIMERVVPDVVDSPKFPNVKSAKVIYSDAYEAGRKDLIVIYADDPESMKAVVSVIQGYRSMGRFTDGAFRDPLPVGIKWLARGMGTASQPPGTAVLLGTGGPSYGKYLSQVLAIAMSAANSIKPALTQGEFVTLAEVVLRKAGIDPKFPDTIGPRATDFASCCPFQAEDAIPQSLLESIQKEAGL